MEMYNMCVLTQHRHSKFSSYQNGLEESLEKYKHISFSWNSISIIPVPESGSRHQFFCTLTAACFFFHNQRNFLDKERMKSQGLIEKHNHMKYHG